MSKLDIAPRMRMFAGPNGSGKSTIKAVLSGHPVPEDKIISRYYHSLELLPEAVSYSDRTYIFDNSGHERVWVAEVTDGEVLEMKTEKMPHWFKTALWDKFDPEDSEGAP